ncbi:hypothetical protein Y032_0303g1887 [Ancylostoma ceylanicum]|uniref:Uncharacterized protein n=1 Tax=Ancylostoma ceylanicum TaxID=53326 RepID=A0A016S3X3_9BILA|nr:hypothetical protein Y032_0303g1887 [Ancylostoma ceylanicum]
MRIHPFHYRLSLSDQFPLHNNSGSTLCPLCVISRQETTGSVFSRQEMSTWMDELYWIEEWIKTSGNVCNGVCVFPTTVNYIGCGS